MNQSKSYSTGSTRVLILTKSGWCLSHASNGKKHKNTCDSKKWKSSLQFLQVCPCNLTDGIYIRRKDVSYLWEGWMPCVACDPGRLSKWGGGFIPRYIVGAGRGNIRDRLPMWRLFAGLTLWAPHIMKMGRLGLDHMKSMLTDPLHWKN